jgi:hypothetical protein
MWLVFLRTDRIAPCLLVLSFPNWMFDFFNINFDHLYYLKY